MSSTVEEIRDQIDSAIQFAERAQEASDKGRDIRGNHLAITSIALSLSAMAQNLVEGITTYEQNDPNEF